MRIIGTEMNFSDNGFGQKLIKFEIKGIFEGDEFIKAHENFNKIKGVYNLRLDSMPSTGEFILKGTMDKSIKQNIHDLLETSLKQIE